MKEASMNDPQPDQQPSESHKQLQPGVDLSAMDEDPVYMDQLGATQADYDTMWEEAHELTGVDATATELGKVGKGDG
jgi:hypothetical protein